MHLETRDYDERGGFVIFVDGDDIIIPGAGAELWRHRSAWSVLGGRVEVAGMPRPLETSPWSLPRWCGWRFSHGGLMAGDRATFIDCGGFDENILLGGTETEFAIRAQSQFGVGFVAVPGARLTYRTPISARGRFGKNFRRERGYAYTQRRHRAVVVDDGWRWPLADCARGAVGDATAPAGGRADGLRSHRRRRWASDRSPGMAVSGASTPATAAVAGGGRPWRGSELAPPVAQFTRRSRPVQ